MLGIPDYQVLMVLAAIGAVSKQGFGYLIAKQKTPSMPFSWEYAQATFIFVVTVAYLFADTSFVLSPQQGIVALLSGWGGQNVITKGLQLLPTPSKTTAGE